MTRLYEWVGERGLRPAGMPKGVFLTDPAAGMAEAAWEVQAPVAGDIAENTADSSRLGTKRIEPRLVASAMHRGPYETVNETYEELTSWIDHNNFAVAGPPEELYFSDPGTTAPADYLTEVRLPISKK
jgi:AraC family transcriptional regulator